MNRSEQINELAAALAAAQGAFINPPRNREVRVTMKSGGGYSFAYATLDTIIDVVRGPLSTNKLAFVQMPEIGADNSVVITRLMHASGQWIESRTPLIIRESGPQAFGSAMTYARRYGLTALLGITAEDDDDANAAEGNEACGTDRNVGGARNLRAAAPQPPESTVARDAKALAGQIRQAIDSAPYLLALNATMEGAGQVSDQSDPKPGSRLALIKEASETAYMFIVDRANKRRAALAQAPGSTGDTDVIPQ